MTTEELAHDACINCGEVKADTRTIEPWGILCADCDEAMQDYYVDAHLEADYEDRYME